MGERGAQDVKQRALKVTWKEVVERPTDVELLSAFSPVGTVVRVQIKVNVCVSLSVRCACVSLRANVCISWPLSAAWSIQVWVDGGVSRWRNWSPTESKVFLRAFVQQDTFLLWR